MFGYDVDVGVRWPNMQDVRQGVQTGVDTLKNVGNAQTPIIPALNYAREGAGQGMDYLSRRLWNFLGANQTKPGTTNTQTRPAPSEMKYWNPGMNTGGSGGTGAPAGILSFCS